MAVGHPLDTIKTRLQTDAQGRFRGTLECIRYTARSEGLLGFYKGGSIPLLFRGVSASIIFGTYALANEQLNTLLGRPGRDQGAGVGSAQDECAQAAGDKAWWQILACGAVAGCAAAPVVCPQDQIKCCMQVQYRLLNGQPPLYSGPLDYAIKETKKHGIRRGLYRFLPITMLEMSCFAVWFGVYEACSKTLKHTFPTLNSDLISFWAGGCSGTALGLTILPIETVKGYLMTETVRVYQTQQEHLVAKGTTTAHSKLKWTSARNFPAFIGCARSIWQSHGWKGFYRGLLPMTIRGFPVSGAMFVSHKFALNILEG